MIRWGVLGTARIAEQQVVPAITRSDNGLPLAVSSGSGREREFADRLGIERGYPSHHELLADAEVDAVYIPLPNNLHAEWTIRALRAGKHVLCEKPIALGPAEFDAITAAAEESGRLVAEAFMYRHHPQIAKLRELVAGIGDIVAIEGRFHFVLDPAAGPNIRLEAASGGGALRDIGCYPIDLMHLLMNAPPDEVVSAAVTLDGTVDSSTGALLRWGSTIGTLTCSFRSPAYDGCLVIGTEGTVSLRAPFRPDRTAAIVESNGEAVEVPGDLYRLEVEDFARRVQTGEPDETGWQLSRWTAETTDRIAAAAGLQRF